VDAFVEYADVVSRRLGDRVAHWTTHNEPWCVATLGHEQGVHAPGRRDPAEALRVAHHLLLSHGRGVEVLRRNAPRAEVGIALMYSPVEPATASAVDGDAATVIEASVGGSFNAATILQSAIDPERLWVGLFNGLTTLRWRDGRWIDEGRLPMTDQVRSVVETKDGVLWAGTQTTGVIRVVLDRTDAAGARKAELTRFGTAQGLPVGGIVVNEVDGVVWFSSFTDRVRHFRFDATAARFVQDHTFDRPAQRSSSFEDERKQPVIRTDKIIMAHFQRYGPAGCAHPGVDYRYMDRTGWEEEGRLRKHPGTFEDILRRDGMADIGDLGIRLDAPRTDGGCRWVCRQKRRQPVKSGGRRLHTGRAFPSWLCLWLKGKARDKDGIQACHRRKLLG
jgi:hypothetical protein